MDINNHNLFTVQTIDYLQDVKKAIELKSRGEQPLESSFESDSQEDEEPPQQLQ